MTLPFMVGGFLGYVIGRDGRPEPVDIPSAVEVLRSTKPETYRKVTIDMSEARDNVELAFVGNFVAIKDVDSSVDLNIRLNESGNSLLNLSRVRQIRNSLYYRLFLTNSAGTGSVELILAIGSEFLPPDDVSVTVGHCFQAPEPTDRRRVQPTATTGRLTMQRCSGTPGRPGRS